MKIKVTCTYEYGGDASSAEQAVDEEKKALINGDVSICDIVADGDCELTVESIGELIDAEVLED